MLLKELEIDVDIKDNMICFKKDEIISYVDWEEDNFNISENEMILLNTLINGDYGNKIMVENIKLLDLIEIYKLLKNLPYGNRVAKYYTEDFLEKFTLATNIKNYHMKKM